MEVSKKAQALVVEQRLNPIPPRQAQELSCRKSVIERKSTTDPLEVQDRSVEIQHQNVGCWRRRNWEGSVALVEI